MQIVVDKDKLLSVLKLARAIADKQNALTSVANVLLEAADGSVTVSATDLHITLVAEIEATTSEGAASVDARNLFDIIKGLPAGEVSLKKLDNNYLDIRANKSKYKMVGMAASDYPKLPDVQEVEYAEIDAKTLANMISKTIFAVSADENRLNIGGIFFECDGKTARMVSTDGHKMCKIECEIGSGPVLEKGVLILRKGIVEIKRLIDAADGTCDIGFDERRVLVRCNDIVIAADLLDATFVPYNQLISEKHEREFEINRKELLQSLKRAAVVCNREAAAQMTLNENLLRIETDNPDAGEAVEEMDIEYDGEELTVGYNIHYAIEILDNIESKTVAFKMNGDLDPIQIVDNSYLALLMPMRV